MTFGFVLSKEKHDFYQQLARKLTKALAEYSFVQGTAVIEFSSSENFKDFSNLMQVMIGRVDAAAATSITHQDVTAVLSWFKQVKVSTFAISNDFVQGI